MLISSETGSECQTILGHLQLIDRMGICVLSQAHGSELRGSEVISILREEKKNGFFSLVSARVCALGWPLLGFFPPVYFSVS